MNYIIENVNILDVINDKVLENRFIYIENGIIKKIQENSIDIKNVKRMDLKGKFIMPGLINMHVHLFGTGKPSKNLTGGKNQQKILKFVSKGIGKKILLNMVYKHALNELYSGVTTIRSVGDFYYSDVLVRDKINQGKLGPRLIVSGPAITTSNGHGAGTFAITSDDIDGIKALVRKNHDMKVDFIKTCTTGGVMDAKRKGEPGEVKMSYEQTKALVDEAHRLNMMVASHVESPEGVLIALRAGVDTIEHGSKLDSEAISLFKNNHSKFIQTLSPALPLALLDTKYTMLSEVGRYNAQVVFENMIECGKVAIKENIEMGLGTDASCPFVSQYNTYKELLYCKKYLNISNEKAIKLSTISNATILKLQNEIGSVEEGKIADLIILDSNPYLDLEALSKVNMVIKYGRIIKHPKPRHNKKIDKMLKKLYNND